MTKRAAAQQAEQVDDLINPDDFKSMEIKINLNNTTTKTEIRDGQRIFGLNTVKIKKDEKKETLSIQIVEFQDHGFVLDVPSLVCAKGHNLVLEVTAEAHKLVTVFHASAKVTEIEKLSTGREQITLVFTQFDVREWNSLKGMYSNRQEEIFKFFNAVKDS